MANFLENSLAGKFQNRYNISKRMLWLVMAFSAAPLFSVLLYLFSGNSIDNIIFFNLKGSFYTNLWTVFGIAAALFAGVLAYIDYTIRKEITITLFGATLLVSAILDVYYLLILNENTVETIQLSQQLYFIWWVNRFFYSLTLLIGTTLYVKIKARDLRSASQKQRIIIHTVITSFLAGIACVVLIANTDTIVPQKLAFTHVNNIDLLSFLPLIFLFIWAAFYLPKFMYRFQSIFSKLLILSIVPLFLAQLFMSLSAQAFDTYFNSAHYLRFISYLVPLAGIILNYVETVRNEQKMLTKLDTEVREREILTSNLKKREALLANAEQIAQLGSWELDIENNAYKWSDELYKIYGFSDSSFQPTHAILEQIIAPEYTQKLNKELAQSVKNKTNFAAEYQVLHPSGVRRYVLGQGYYNAKENKLVGTVQDITELKEATLKLRKNETLLREGQAVSQNGSWEFHSSDPLVFWSDEMFNIHGVLPHGIIITLNSYIDFVHPQDIDLVKKAFADARGTETSFKINYRIVRPNGEIRYLSTTAKYKQDEVGSGYSYLGNTQDVTSLREAERKLEEKILELNVSNKDLEQFAYVASHDLQEPLRKIRAFGDRLKARVSGSIDAEGKDYIERMQNAAERMQALIDDLLTFSKVARDSKEFQDVDLNAVFTQVLQDLDYTIERSNAIINLDITEHVEGIAPQLAQVFQNIISNSLKFVQAEIQPVIDISAKILTGKNLPIKGALPHQQYYVIKIADNGIGFEEEYASKIFDLFQRLHSRTDYKGTGIGLAICKKIVEKHAGFIFAKSIEGAGASFFIALPIRTTR